MSVRAMRNFSDPIKLVIRLSLVFVVFYWAGQATIKLHSKPTGTKLQYKIGDDNKGNFKLFALTICPGSFENYKLLEKDNLTPIPKYNIEYLIHQVKNGQTFADNVAKLKWNIADIMDFFFINGENVNVTQTWKPVMDSFYGMCHTFDPSLVNNGRLYKGFFNHESGTFSNAEARFTLDVTYTKMNKSMILNYDSFLFRLAN